MNKSGRLLTIICLSLALLLLIIVRVELKTQAASSREGTPEITRATEKIVPMNRAFKWQAPQAGPKEKTIGETQKNIKVLNDIPASQLIPMMNLFAGSLGVKCTYCHVNKDGQWDFPADEKPEKNTAREMILMTLNINKTTFKGSNEVSCFSCHRGRNRPVSLLALPIPEPTPRPTETAPGAAAQPTADDILNKYTNAIGGQAAIDKLTTRTMRGNYTLANGATGTYEVTQTAPDRFYVARGSQQGIGEQGFNGTAGWQKDGRGVADMRPDQLNDLKAEYQFFRDLKLKEQYTRTNLRKDKLDGRDVYVITGVRADKKRDRLFFDAETGLLLRRMGYVETPLGMVPDQTDYEDYRDVDGVKVPFTVKIAVVGGFSTATRKFTEIKFNAPVDDSRFNKPAMPVPPAVQPKP